MINTSHKSSFLTGFVAPRARAPQPAPSDAAMPENISPQPEPLPEAEFLGAASEPGSAAMQVVVVRGAQALSTWVAAWQDLADKACEPNVFYEPWMLLPALEAFAPTPAPEFHLVFAPGRGPDTSKPLLCGLFPLVRGRSYKGVRTQVLKSWRHLYCPLGTPLLRRGQEAETLHALLDFYRTRRGGATLLELNCVSGDGPFGRALVEVFCDRGTTTFMDEIWTRAFLRPRAGASGEDYLKDSMTGKRRKEFRRKEHRLADEGLVQYTQLERETEGETHPGAALESYLADFLRLEASGWKGEAGSAFSCEASHQQFFRTIATEAHARGRLILSTLRVNGDAIAAKCDFRAGTGAFAFKIGFDEKWSRFSPGVLLELEIVRRLHNQSAVRWMDSCAVRDHPMINRLWQERRTLQTLVIATGRGRGEFVVAGLSLMRHFKRMVRRTRKQKNAARSVSQSAS